jgi:hypothetical protein
MINLALFNHLSESLSVLECVETDFVELLIPCSVEGNEGSILRVMHYSIACSIQSQLSQEWRIVGYGIASNYFKEPTYKEGIEIILHRKNGSHDKSITTKFELLPNLSLQKTN